MCRVQRDVAIRLVSHYSSPRQLVDITTLLLSLLKTGLEHSVMLLLYTCGA